jgi:predicted DNA-binding transcriptional regulator YafY
VTERTVYRDVGVLQQHGIPINGVRGRSGGYRLEAESPFSSLESFGKLGSTDAVLLLALRAAVSDTTPVKGTGGLFGGLAKEEVNQLTKFGERIHFDTREWYWRDAPETVVPQLRRALLEERVLQIRYRSRESKTIRSDLVEPYGLIWKGGSWYLVGRSTSSDGIIRYRASRFLEIEVTESQFKYPRNFDLRKWWDNELEAFGAGPIRVRLLAGEDARDELLGLAGKEDTNFADRGDRLELTLHVDRWAWLVPLLLSFAGSVVVEEPPALRKAVVVALHAGLAAQEKGSPQRSQRIQAPGDWRQRVTRGRES